MNEMLRLLDSFAQRREHWLKVGAHGSQHYDSNLLGGTEVAGGAKAEVLLHTYGLRTWQWHEAQRLSRWVCR